MTSGNGRKRALAFELDRRRVISVTIAYAVGAWAIIESSALLIDTFDWPPVFTKVIIVGAVVGFPVVMALACLFDVSTDSSKANHGGALPGNGTASIDQRGAPQRAKMKQIEAIALSCLPIKDASSLDLEDQLALHTEFSQRFKQTVKQHGGVCLEAPGLELRAVFGISRKIGPALTRAVECSHDIRSHLGDDTRIGLHVGSVLVQKKTRRRELMSSTTALGETGQLALRIAHAAPQGRIAISADTAKHLGSDVALQPLDKSHTDGRADAQGMLLPDSS